MATTFPRTIGLIAALLTGSAVMTASKAEPFHVIATEEASLADIHAALARKQLTVRQLVQAYLDRIEAYDKRAPALNAIIMVNPGALAAAEALDQEFARTGNLKPLHGVPVIVKDNYDTTDMPTSAGSLSLKGSVSASDAFIVRKMREAGAIMLAKSNMAEFAWSPFETVGSLLPGYTRNPYALDRVPAGSSDGTRPSPPILALSGWAPILAIQSAGHRRTPAWSASARRWG